MAMKRENVQSSAIASIGYDKDDATLEVRFNSGRPNNFAGVSPEVYTKFMESNSKGRFFNEKIKNRYKLK